MRREHETENFFKEIANKNGIVIYSEENRYELNDLSEDKLKEKIYKIMNEVQDLIS